ATIAAEPVRAQPRPAADPRVPPMAPPPIAPLLRLPPRRPRRDRRVVRGPRASVCEDSGRPEPGPRSGLPPPTTPGHNPRASYTSVHLVWSYPSPDLLN